MPRSRCLERFFVFFPAALFALALGLALVLGCSASRHPTEPGAMGEPSSSAQMGARLSEPGPIRFERLVAADWEVPLSGLVNLDHPKARAAGLEDGPEAIQIYLYALEHPRFGTFLVDSGVESGFRSPGGSPRVSGLVASAMATEKLEIHTTTAEWLAKQDGPPAGVFVTHIHLDHIMGLPDLPEETPVYVGPGETGSRAFLNLFSRGTTDRLLARSEPLRVWPFEADPSGRFAGVIDVFGDGSLFALHAPGHTPGSTAFLVRSTDGPKLLTGDVCHTRWGWENGVEPGSFTADHAANAVALETLRALAAEHPEIEVHLGHQSLRN